MSLSQPKIDLAVLYKLYQHAEAGGGAIPPRDVFHLFGVHIPARRVELALEELSAKGDVEREYHPHYSDEGLWQISRTGMARVDRALKVPASFIARLHANGDAWLESDEAEQAVLKKLSEQPAPDIGPKSVVISTPETMHPLSAIERDEIDWTKWGAIAGLAAIPVAIFVAWYFGA